MDFKQMEENAKKNTYDAYLKSRQSNDFKEKFLKPQDLYREYGSSEKTQEGSGFENKNSHEKSRENEFKKQKTEKPKNSILNLINIKGLDLDGDTAIIGLLILLLSKDEADELLLMALVYVML